MLILCLSQLFNFNRLTVNTVFEVYLKLFEVHLEFLSKNDRLLVLFFFCLSLSLSLIQHRKEYRTRPRRVRSRLSLLLAQSASHLDELHQEINGVLREKGGGHGQYGRGKFYSLVIHGCLRITGSLLLRTVRLSSRPRECTVTREEKRSYL